MASQGVQSLPVASQEPSVIESEGHQGSKRMPAQRYEEVAADLIAKINDGTYPPGAKLPSRKDMRTIYKISDSVSDKALMIVRATGLVETLPGVGVYVR
jgi:DNA-binding GntR family transcriptional regulator